MSVSTDVTRRRNKFRPRVSEIWPDSESMRLIKLVKQNPCVWNPSCEDYKIRRRREEAWENIHKKFGRNKELDQLVGKWQNLRVQFRTCHLKIEKHNLKQTKWKFYEAMIFLVNADEASKISHEDYEYKDEPELSTEEVLIEFPTENSEDVRCEIFKQEELSAQQTPNEIVPKERTIEEIMFPIQDQWPIETTLPASEVEDEIAIFGKFLISNLRKIRNDNYRQKAQRKLIQELFKWMDMEEDAQR